MKKFKGFVAITAALVLAMSTFAMAEATKIEAENGTVNNLNDSNAQEKGGASVIGLKSPDDQATSLGTVTFGITVETAGTYEVKVRYNGKGDRAASLAVNGTVVAEDIITEEHADYETYAEYVGEVTLNAGTNSIVLSGVTGKKAPNIDWISYELKEAAQQPTTETPTTEAPTTEETPTTGDVASVLPVAVIVVAAMAVVVFMRKKTVNE